MTSKWLLLNLGFLGQRSMSQWHLSIGGIHVSQTFLVIYEMQQVLCLTCLHLPFQMLNHFGKSFLYLKNAVNTYLSCNFLITEFNQMFLLEWLPHWTSNLRIIMTKSHGFKPSLGQAIISLNKKNTPAKEASLCFDKSVSKLVTDTCCTRIVSLLKENFYSEIIVFISENHSFY